MFTEVGRVQHRPDVRILSLKSPEFQPSLLLAQLSKGRWQTGQKRPWERGSVQHKTQGPSSGTRGSLWGGER